MPDPVKLSRERWEMLCRSVKSVDEQRITVTLRNSGNIATVTQPLEIAGIIFLPAEYVPPSDPVRPETWWQRAYSA